MDKKKKIIFIVIIILISIILGILIIYCNIQNTKLKELDKIQKESLLDMNDKIEYGQEVTYEDILTKIVNTEKLPKNTKIEILINDKPLSNFC